MEKAYKKLGKIYDLAMENKTTVRDILINHFLTPERKQKIVEVLQEDDEDFEEDMIEQLCDTPRSQARLLSIF